MNPEDTPDIPTEDDTPDAAPDAAPGPLHKMVEPPRRPVPKGDRCPTCKKPADVVHTHLRSSGLVIEVLACGHKHVFHDG